MRHFYRYRICLPASTSVYTYTHTRAKILSHRVSIFSIFFLSFQQFESLKKMAINHRGIDNVLLDIYIYIYIYERRNINNLAVRDSTVGPLIPHSWYGYPRVDPTPLAHQRRHKARSDGANYLFHELPPTSFLPPPSPRARTTDRLPF